MNQTYILRYIIISLFAISAAICGYKYIVLGFPLWASEEETVWKIEAKVEFEAVGEPVEVKLNLPEAPPERKLSALDEASLGYDYEIVQTDGARYALWEKPSAVGKQTLYLRAVVHYSSDPIGWDVEPRLAEVSLTPIEQTAAQELIQSLESVGFERNLLDIVAKVNSANLSPILLDNREERVEKAKLMTELFTIAKIPARYVRGIKLTEDSSSQGISDFIEVYDSERGAWKLVDPIEERFHAGSNAVIVQKEGEALFEVYGGKDSRISFTTLREQWPAYLSAYQSAAYADNYLMDFSLYSLPANQQKAFKLLLLIPLGALVVVILRNLVGIHTSGTFMPVLIAMVFLQTNLVVGLCLFLAVVSLGLGIRTLLSRLNLLLVPRIASVLVVVIVIYAAIGIVGHKLGLDWAAKVTFFPMIILSWTIERMSILWEEEGAKEVLVQGGGSLFTAVLAFIVMGNSVIADTVFLYPEILLSVLALIMLIGSYTGYRLSDLRRFESMEQQ